MIGLIIWGTRGVESVIKQGRFFCPTCGPETRFRQKRVRRFFTLYFIPLIPLDTVGQFVECGSCAGTFKVEVLSYDPDAGREEAEAEFRQVMRRVMVDIMMADGKMDQAELKTLATIYERVGGKPLSKRRLEIELERREQEGTEGTVAYLREARGFLNYSGKLLVIRGALAVAAADGEFQQEEQVALAQYADALGVSAKEYRGLVAEVFTPGEG